MFQIGLREYSDSELGQLECEFAADRVNLKEFIKSCVGEPATYDRIKSTMTQLEAVAEWNRRLGIFLMTGLYDLADEARAHDVCDAIDLWIENEGDAALADFLQIAQAPAARTAKWVKEIRGRRS